MKPFQNKDIYGSWATLLVPIHADESIDMVLLSEEIDKLISFQPNGIYSNGTAGEFYNQTEDEFDQISHLLAEKCENAGISFQLGVNHMSPVISLGRLRRIVSLKPCAVQVILPDWVVPTIEESISFLKKMVEISSPIGLVLYNPPHAKRVLTPEEFGLLKQNVPELVGIKVAGGDKQWYEQMRAHCQGLSVFIPGHHLATGIKQGAQGAYSNMACLHPAVAQQWYHQMQDDIDSALELEDRIGIFMGKHIIPFIHQGYSNQAVDKFMAAVGGWCNIGTRLRWPYKGIDESHIESTRKEAKEIIPEFIV